MKKIIITIISALIVVLAIGLYMKFVRPGAETTHPETELMKVESTKKIRTEYDVIVVGTDPEGVMAAISSARNGLKTLLVDGRDRDNLGGLYTLGWLNSIDHNYAPGRKVGSPSQLNKGLFQEWYDQTEGTSFDIVTAANAFYRMVRHEKNIDLLLHAKQIAPLMGSTIDESASIEGVRIVKADGSAQDIKARAVIDATQDADIAAAAGVPYTWGREDVGDKQSLMAVTLVFKLSGVTPDVWQQMGKREGVGTDKTSAWGYAEMWNYPSTNPDKVRMRGLNIGRQNDESILINALQIFDVNPLDAESVREAFEIGKNEINHVIDYMKTNFTEFAEVELAGTAPELYVRETRHIVGEYRLSMVDVLDNRDQWDRIAFGSYSVDLQSTSFTERGSVISQPQQYAVPFRSIVPVGVDGLLVVGRAASFDSLPHGSARVVPVGMATGEAAGAAAKLAMERGMTFREMSQSRDIVAELQRRLERQGMDLTPKVIEVPEYSKHKAYDGLKAAVSMGIAVGGYKNENFALDAVSNAARFGGHFHKIKKVHPAAFPGEPRRAPELEGLSDEAVAERPLTLEEAAYTIGSVLGLASATGAGPDAGADVLETLVDGGYVREATLAGIEDREQLTNGDTYMLIRDVVAKAAGVVYE